MSRFTKPSVSWADLEKLVPPDQRHKFLAFKGKSDGYLRRVNANPPEPPKIDWAMYEKTVPVPGLVSKFKDAYEKYKVPFPSDTMSAEIDKQWASLQGNIKSFVSERQKEIEVAKKELAHIAALPPFETMTMETFYDMYPDLALDSVKNPTFWPHNPEEQLGYKPPEMKTDK